MKKILFILAILSFTTSVLAQEVSEKEKKKHAEKVKKSREKGKNIRSMDTLFASGVPYCLMIGMKKTLGVYGAFSVRPLKKPDTEEIYLETSSVGQGTNAVWFWDMVFVIQGQQIRFKSGELDLENTIVDYNLMNDTGLNVVGMNKLVLLKGRSGRSVPPARNIRNSLQPAINPAASFHYPWLYYNNRNKEAIIRKPY